MIIRVDPDPVGGANTVQLDSDAPDNLAAMREIDQWAADHGFARTTEFWLRRAKLTDGRLVYRGVCFKVTADEIAAAADVERQIDARMARMPVTELGTGGR